MPTDKRASVRGFGYREDDANGYHFEVKHETSGAISLSERFSSKTADEPLYNATPRYKGELTARRWEMVRDTVAEEFSHRLKSQGMSGGRWLKAMTPLAPSLGKELAVLIWAIDDADPIQIPRMLANWRALAPEERWWFYTTINAGFRPNLGKPTTGWLAAIKVAFLAEPQDLGLDMLRTSDAKKTIDDWAKEPKQGRLFSEPDSPEYKV